MHITIYIVAGSVIFITGLVLFLRRLQKTAIIEVNNAYPEAGRKLTSPMANLFGVRSAGYKQIRGNGILLATDSTLYFRMLLPRREMLIPFGSIESVETPRSFLGKTKGVKLLKVDFRNADGKQDSAAWLVDNLDTWIKTLRDS